MDEIKQSQKAGDNVVQTQIGTQIIVGIDEKCVREICDQKIALAINDLSYGASEVGRQRIDALTDKVIEKIKKDPSNIQAFSDPSFQRDIIRAQIAAAESDREPDIETLSELLLARMNGKLKRSTKTGLRKAIEIVPELEDVELAALTVLLFCNKYRINNLSALYADQSLASLNHFFAKIFASSKLPEGIRWLQHLSILDCVEVDHARHFEEFEKYFEKVFNGIICVGLAKGSPEHIEAAKIMNECGVGDDILVQNDLLTEHVRLPIVNLGDLSRLPLNIPNTAGFYTMNPTEKHKEVLKKVIGLYKKDSALLQKAKSAFVKKMSKYWAICRFRDWLASQKHYFDLTPIGEALAYVNARRCIPELPIIELE